MSNAADFAWLVERSDQPVYWVGISPSLFTSDHCKAMRFARRIDAQNAIDWMVDPDVADQCAAIEHGWSY